MPHWTFRESVECSKSVTGQRNAIGVLRASRMWHINSESAECGSHIMILRKVAAETYYICINLLQRLLLICNKTIIENSLY